MKSMHSKPPVAIKKYTSRSRHNINASMEPVKVFCRLRPMCHSNDTSCMKIVSDTTVVITPPETATNFRSANKVIQTSFSHVFGLNASQKEVFDLVTLPLVENLINGKDSLLFTYGVTGSGKTYTMCGNPQEAGIMPRSLNVLFNSIAHCQAKKYIFKPDRLNSFEVQSETDASLDRQNELHTDLISHNGKPVRHRKLDSDTDSNQNTVSQTDESQSLTVDEDNVYAVFVTYVEIYNNSVYDLLEEDDGKTKTFQSKIIREDAHRNMYVHGGTEVEVKSPEEAFEIFQRGQRRRRVAYTNLNAESSRSHSVFTIRLVQAPFDSNGEQIIQDKRAICVSQLSLVDLAGSERTNRSKNTGQRLREAGNINNSLMTLRSCLEILRENQTQGTNKMVPYRDSKLTHMFKNYFDGDGNVRMIICVNPSAEDYDETIQVMKFAEVSQEVQVTNAASTKLDLGYTPGRRQANKIFKEAKSRLEHAGHAEAADLEVDVGLVYSLGGPFPELDLQNPHNDEIISTLMRFLELRIQKRNPLREDLREKQNAFRNMLVKVEHENVSLRIENTTLKAVNDQQKKKITALEAHVCKTEGQIDTLLYRLNCANDAIRHMQQELRNKDMNLNQRAIDKQRVKEKYNMKIQAETSKMSKELETKLRQQRELLETQMKEKEDKLKLVKNILEGDDGTESTTTAETKESVPLINIDTDFPQKGRTPTQAVITETTSSAVPTPATSVKSTPTTKLQISEDIRLSRKDRIPVVNLRYRRSRSVDKWIDHRPPGLVPVGTILQPLLRRKRSVTQLTDPKDFTDRASRYCLVAQDQDTDGELETKLYKGDILPTSGGGAQVVFNDMERLKQVSPVGRRKRSSYFSPEKKEAVPMNECPTTSANHSKKPRV